MIYRDHRLKTFEDPIKIGNKSLAWDEFSDVENFDRLIDSGFIIILHQEVKLESLVHIVGILK